MTDSLRTRIAAVLRTYMFENSTAEELADAVIAELGLTREDGITSPLKTAVWPAGSVPNCPSNTHRYVTEWELKP